MSAFRFKWLPAAALALVSAAAWPQSPSAPAADSGALPLGQIRPMTVAAAKRLVAAAIKAACPTPDTPCSGAFAIADDAGVIVYLETIDGVLAGGPELAMKKAQTPALWRRPTRQFRDAVAKGTNVSYADGSYPDMTTSPGGLPLFKDGRVVGGFGLAAVGGHASDRIGQAVLEEAERIFGKQ